ncbi:hypothetical protein BKA81DRAFT_41087 [Phyllosticta paracitricarpa]
MNRQASVENPVSQPTTRTAPPHEDTCGRHPSPSISVRPVTATSPHLARPFLSTFPLLFLPSCVSSRAIYVSVNPLLHHVLIVSSRVRGFCGGCGCGGWNDEVSSCLGSARRVGEKVMFGGLLLSGSIVKDGSIRIQENEWVVIEAVAVEVEVLGRKGQAGSVRCVVSKWQVAAATCRLTSDLIDQFSGLVQVGAL